MTDKKNAFKWTQLYDASGNLLDLDNVAKAQLKMMHHLFPEKKNKYLLPEWHNAYSASDLHLYAGFGLISPLEYNFFKNHMAHWHLNFLDEQIERGNVQEGEQGRVVFIDEKDLPNFTLSALIKNFDFDSNENLLLRLDQPLKLVDNLNYALSQENIRTDKKNSLDVLDSLTCEYDYPKTSRECWSRLNQMVSSKDSILLNLPLTNSKEAMESLNGFEIYRALADVEDYGRCPLVKQRYKGKLDTYFLRQNAIRVQTALGHLEEKGFWSPDLMNRICALTSEERNNRSLMLKRSVLASFLTDMFRAAPTEDWLERLYSSSMVYFRPLFKELGTPEISVDSFNVKTSRRKDKHFRLVNVSFGKDLLHESPKEKPQDVKDINKNSRLPRQRSSGAER